MKQDIEDIMNLIDNNDIQILHRDYPRIKFEDLKSINWADIELSSLNKYTMLELKVIYYILTKDKDNNAIKTCKKECVFNAVREVIFSIRRGRKLGIH